MEKYERDTWGELYSIIIIRKGDFLLYLFYFEMLSGGLKKS